MRSLQDRQRIVVRAIIEAEHDDGAHLRATRARVAAAVRVARHPVHVAMRAGGEEFAQSSGRVWNCIRARDADGVEALGAGRLGERGLERGRCGRRQKSRLA